MMTEFTREELLHYSRHLLIPEVGLDGQRRLKGSSVLIVGTGGLGSPVSLYLAAAGVGHIGLVDFDVVDPSNLQRQVVHGTAAIGKLKVESARDRLLDINPRIQVDIHNTTLTSANAFQIAEPYSIIVDGSDNFPTRYLTNDLCVLTGKPNVYGAVSRFDGQASFFYAKTGPCYRCLFPEPPPPGMVPSCSEAGILGVLPGTIGTIQATETIKWLLGIGSSLLGRLLLYNALDMTFDTVKIKKNPHCKVCGDQPEITTLIDYFSFCGVPGVTHDEQAAVGEYWISPRELEKKIKSGMTFQLVDVREPHELKLSRLTGAINIPLGELSGRIQSLNKADDLVVFCRVGVRSTRAVEMLIRAGFRKVNNLKGGINAWAKEIDQNLIEY